MASPICMDKISRVATLANGLGSTSAAGVLGAAMGATPKLGLGAGKSAASMTSLSLPSLMQANGVASLLSNFPVKPVVLGKMAFLSQLKMLSANAGKVFGPGVFDKLGADALQGRVQRVIQALESLIRSRPPDSVAGLQARIQLGWAAASLAQLGIDVFSPTGATKLADYLQRLRSSGALRELQAPRVSMPMFNGLLGLETFAAVLPAWPRSGVGAGALGAGGAGKELEALLARSKMGPMQFLLSGSGGSLLPGAARMQGISLLLAELRAERALRASLPAIGGVGARKQTDILATFEASGCCRVLQDFGGLQSSAMGAAKLETLSRGISVAQRSFGVDLRAPDAGKMLSAGLAQTQSSLNRALESTSPLSGSAATQLSGMSQLFWSIIQAKDLGLLVRLLV